MPNLEAQGIFDPHVPSRVMEKAPLLLRDAAWVLPSTLQFQATLQVETQREVSRVNSLKKLYIW